MESLLIIADDLTGALDSGVAFSKAGIPTRVIVSGGGSLDGESPVTVVLADTRHTDAEAAYRAVFDIVSAARKSEFRYIFKKTDSALRGNIGAELRAALDASGEDRLVFAPAYPEIGRVTRGGVQYIDGDTPVSESVFASDPFNPVKHSSVAEIIAETSENVSGIEIVDAASAEDMRNIAEEIKSSGIGLVAGCAGLANALAAAMGGGENSKSELPRGNIAVFCGSVNPISLAQLEAARQNGAELFTLADGTEVSRLIAASCEKNSLTLFATGETPDVSDAADGRQIAAAVSRIIDGALSENPDFILFIVGGDTLLAFMERCGIKTLYPAAELFPGVVLSKYSHGDKERFLISKSGGFGGRTLLSDIYLMLNDGTAFKTRR